MARSRSKGPQGKLSWKYQSRVGHRSTTRRPSRSWSPALSDGRQARALHGLGLALVQNMVVGVTKGYEKKLEIVGVGYLAAVQKGELQLRVGFANEVHLPIPTGSDRHLPRSDARRDQGGGQANGRPVRRRGPGRPQARAL